MGDSRPQSPPENPVERPASRRRARGFFRSQTFNPLLRATAKIWMGLHRAVMTRFVTRVRVSGTVDLAVCGQRFSMFSDWDDHIVDHLFFQEDRYRELSELRLFAAFAAQSRVILDVGANTGLYSIVSAKVSASTALHAFEPYPVNFSRLKKNVALNGLAERVRLVETALGDVDGQILLTVPANGEICDVSSADRDFASRHYREWLSYKDIPVRQMTLDTYCAAEQISGVDLMKIDVENFELPVLRGAVATLERNSPVILIEIFVDDERKAFFDNVLQPLGYYCYLVMPNGLVRVDSLIANPDCGNFVLSRRRSTDAYLSFSDLNTVVAQLRAPL